MREGERGSGRSDWLQSLFSVVWRPVERGREECVGVSICDNAFIWAGEDVEELKGHEIPATTMLRSRAAQEQVACVAVP